MMKKEEFLTKLRKNLSVLEEREIQDIVEEYEQHIDMKTQQGLSEEAAINDFGDLKELTAGILEAYHVKADYNVEKKNIDFDKVKEESKKATEKATNAIGKGAGTAGKWGIRQIKKLWSFIKKPFILLKSKVHTSKKGVQEKGFWGKLWMFVLGVCSLVWHCVVWCVRLFWNLFWLFMGIFAGFSTLSCIFLFGTLVVFLIMGYPVIGATLITVGGGMISGAIMVFCFSLLKRKSKNRKDTKKDFDTKNSDFEDSEEEENNWEYPENHETPAKQITVNAYQEVLNHA